eukprot:4984974-Pyramimonas_sp.AAC.1
MAKKFCRKALARLSTARRAGAAPVGGSWIHSWRRLVWAEWSRVAFRGSATWVSWCRAYPYTSRTCYVYVSDMKIHARLRCGCVG